MATAFVFREFDVSEPLRVELRDDDAPYGHAQEEAAFEVGGEAVRKRIKLPGRREPLFHMLHPDDRPLVVRGAFRDYRMGHGHANAMKRLIERLRARMNLLRVTWNGDQWTAVLGDALFGVEAPGHITYELTFDIGVPPDVSNAQAPSFRRPDSDAVERSLAKLRARRTFPARPGNLLTTLNNVMTGIESGLQAFGDAVRVVENTRDNITRQLRRVTSLGSRVMQQIAAGERLVESTRRQLQGIAGSAQDVSAITRWAVGQNADFRLTRATVRSVMAETSRRAAGSSKLYRVRPGDTLESIARQQLGDPGRAGDLGLSPRDLTPGRVVRIPQAAATV